MSLHLVPDLQITEMPEGKYVIRKYIPYLITPHPDAGHIISIVVNDCHACPLVRVETIALGLKYLKSFNPEYILEEVA